ncbi:MAG: phospholipid carrier-dependent glycosyltransferase [Candidatus Pacebacteria bacterium]|nr:phospholipid carrier-dependent glycosyltransferase [Candidatus Paceibacterota bacterium]MDR3583419.1 phospholipid carrier-dependent glycosyltransferase [Candidatus Paceibacterota bacterium]
MDRKKLTIFLVLFAVLGINLLLGLPRLSRFSAVDEPYWTFARIPKFWTAVAAQKWRSTNINDKPGITSAIITGPGLWAIDPLTIKSGLSDPKTQDMAAQVYKVYSSFRLPNYLFTLVGLLLLFFFIRKLLGDRTALIATILIGLSPIILGMSLIINPDSLLWIFVGLSLLSYFIHYKNEEIAAPKEKFELDIPEFLKQKKYILLAGVFLGLALLTKYVANVVFVYFFLLIFLRYIFEKKENESADGYFKKTLLDFFLVILMSAITFGLLFPATWVSPQMILGGTILSAAFKSVWPIFAAVIVLVLLDAIFLKSIVLRYPLDFLARHKNLLVRLGGVIFLLVIIFVLINTWTGMKIYDFQNILSSPKSGKSFVTDPSRLSRDFFSDFWALFFGLTPLAYLALIFSVGKNTLRKNLSQESNYILYLFLFMAIYYLGSAVDGVADMVRYQIALYPLAMIMAAIGIDQIVAWFENGKYKLIAKSYVVYPAIILISAWSLFSVRPFYFTYASGLLPQKYILNLKGVGDGSWEAAQYLNALPNAQNLIIWTDKGAVCETFVGKCITGFKTKDLQGVNFDYFVASTDRGNRSMAMGSVLKSHYDFDRLYSPDGGDFKIIFDGRPNNFVKVMSAASIAKK